MLLPRFFATINNAKMYHISLHCKAGFILHARVCAGSRRRCPRLRLPVRRQCIAQVAPWIHRRAYASVYVRIRPYAKQHVGPRWPCGAFVIAWNACAGLRWPWKFNMFELWRQQSAYERVCAGRNRRQKYKQLRRQSAYACVYTLTEYKPGLKGRNKAVLFSVIVSHRFLLGSFSDKS